MIKSKLRELRVRVQADFVQAVMCEDHFKPSVIKLGALECYGLMASCFDERTDEEFFQYLNAGKSAICMKFAKLVNQVRFQREFGDIEIVEVLEAL